MSQFIENMQLLCAVCKIGAYTLFCRTCCSTPPPPKPEFSAVCIGLEGAGKTTLLTALCKENTDAIQPTCGFLIKAVQFDNCILNAKEIGGSKRLQEFWKQYFPAAQAVIFVVDSASSTSHMADARLALNKALKNDMLKSRPCLILANCQDKPGARTRTQILSDLDLNKLCGSRPWVLQLCSKNNIQQVRDGFTQLIAYMAMPEKDNICKSATANRI